MARYTLDSTGLTTHLAPELVPVHHSGQRQRLIRVEGGECVDIIFHDHVVVVSKHNKPLGGRIGFEHKAETNERFAERTEVVIFKDASVCNER